MKSVRDEYRLMLSVLNNNYRYSLLTGFLKTRREIFEIFPEIIRANKISWNCAILTKTLSPTARKSIVARYLYRPISNLARKQCL